jgi:hypothetical protein
MAAITRSDRIARAFLVLLGVGVAAFLAFLGFTLIVMKGFIGETEVKDRTKDWATFYSKEVIHHFKIPADATVIKAESFEDGWGDGGLKVQFTLAGGKTPDVRLKELADSAPGFTYVFDSKNSVTSKDRESPQNIEYDPDTRTYTAERYW